MISRLVLSERVKEDLLNKILAGAYGPGDRLVESQIAKDLGVSQATVREAIRGLAAMRFVEIEPYKGAKVRMVDQNELAEIYPVRAALEDLAGRLAASRLNGEIRELEQAVVAMRDAASRRDVQEFVGLDADFHRLIVLASGNRILMESWNALMIEQRTLVTTIAVMITEHGLDRVAAMHETILDALRSRDPERVGREMRDHVETFERLIRKGRRDGAEAD